LNSYKVIFFFGYKMKKVPGLSAEVINEPCETSLKFSEVMERHGQDPKSVVAKL